MRSKLTMASAIFSGLILFSSSNFAKTDNGGQDVEPTVLGTQRAYENVPHITVSAHSKRGDEALDLCNQELQSSRQLIIRKGGKGIIEVQPCAEPVRNEFKEFETTGSIYFLN